MKKNFLPISAAVFTRGTDHGNDYDWYFKMGNARLFNTVAELHRLVMKDKESEFPPLIVLFKNSEERVSLLFSDLLSPRVDHQNRFIRNTLYLEFELIDYQGVFKLVADILVSPQDKYEENQNYLSKYSEELYYLAQSFFPLLNLKDLSKMKLEIGESLAHLSGVTESEKVRDMNKSLNAKLKNFDFKYEKSSAEEFIIKKDDLLTELDKFALPNNIESRKYCAKYLLDANPEKGLCIISTGRVGIEKCYQAANSSYTDKCIILTESSEVKEKTALNGKSANTIYKAVSNYLTNNVGFIFNKLK